MAPPNKKAKRSGNSNKHYKKPKSISFLDIHKRGFLVTCNFHEKDCIRESYNILNEYADKLYGGAAVNENVKAESNADGENKECDISDMLAGDISVSKESSHKKAHRFQRVETDIVNCIFIHTTVPDPVELAHYMLSDIAKTRMHKTRYLLRLLPIEVVTLANINDIKKGAATLIEKHFSPQSPTSFCIIFNKRYNGQIKRDECIKDLADLVHANSPLHKVDLRNAEKFLIVEVIKGLCCMSIVRDYYNMKRYNLYELSHAKDNTETGLTEDPSNHSEKPKNSENATVETTESNKDQQLNLTEQKNEQKTGNTNDAEKNKFSNEPVSAEITIQNEDK